MYTRRKKESDGEDEEREDLKEGHRIKEIR